jgi:hypothetical protein
LTEKSFNQTLLLLLEVNNLWNSKPKFSAISDHRNEAGAEAVVIAGLKA